MMRSILFALFCAVPLVSGCATPSEQVVLTAMAEDEDPIVCEKITVIGTRVAQKVCRRQSQIDELERNSQDALEQIQKRGAISTKTAP